MAELKPFRAWRPPRDLVRKVASLPYDVVSAEEARAYAQGNPFSFFHISRPEIDLSPGTDEHSESVYTQGLKNLREFQASGWLIQDPEPRFYIYRQRMGSHVQIGLVAAASVNEYDRGLIKKHENTRPDKEEDRTRHIEALDGNDEPVFLTYRAQASIDQLISRLTEHDPEYDFISEDDIAHTFWLVPLSANSVLGRLFDAVGALYIADGHHRSAAASRVQKRYRSRGAGAGEHDLFLAVVFPDEQMKILDYNRVVKDLNGFSAEAFLDKVRQGFRVEEAARPRPDATHQMGMLLGGSWYRVTAKPGTFDSSPLGVLDVSILQKNLLQPILGIADPRTDKRIHFVGGIRGTAELEKLVNGGEYAVGFSMYPTSLEQVMAIADAGQTMPPKCTWFEPKLRSGLALHLFA